MTKGATTEELLRLRRLCERKQATINRLQDELIALRAANVRGCCAEVYVPDDPPLTLWQRIARWFRV